MKHTTVLIIIFLSSLCLYSQERKLISGKNLHTNSITKITPKNSDMGKMMYKTTYGIYTRGTKYFSYDFSILFSKLVNAPKHYFKFNHSFINNKIFRLSYGKAMGYSFCGYRIGGGVSYKYEHEKRVGIFAETSVTFSVISFKLIAEVQRKQNTNSPHFYANIGFAIPY